MGQDAAGVAEELLQRLGLRVHRDPHPAAPGIQLELRQRSAFGVERALPVLLVEYEGVLALEVVSPAVERADEVAAVARHAVHTVGSVDQLPAAVRADIAVGAQGIAPRTFGNAHDDDRFIADVVREEIAQVGDHLEPLGHLPDLRPQQVLFGLCVITREECLGAVSGGLFKVIHRHVRSRAFRLVHRATPARSIAQIEAREVARRTPRIDHFAVRRPARTQPRNSAQSGLVSPSLLK